MGNKNRGAGGGGSSPGGSTTGQYIGVVSRQIHAAVLTSSWPFSDESVIQKMILDNLICVSISSPTCVSAEVLAFQLKCLLSGKQNEKKIKISGTSSNSLTSQGNMLI